MPERSPEGWPGDVEDRGSGQHGWSGNGLQGRGNQVPVHRTFVFGCPPRRISLVWLVGGTGLDVGNGNCRAADAGYPCPAILSENLECRQNQTATSQFLPCLIAAILFKRESCGKAWQGSAIGGLRDEAAEQVGCDL